MFKVVSWPELPLLLLYQEISTGGDTYRDHSIWEQAFYSNVKGVMDSRVWEAWDRSFRGFVCVPTLNTVWIGIKPYCGTEFQAHTDSVQAYGCSVE